MLRRILDLPLLVLLLGMAGFAMLLPAIHAFAMRDHGLARSFVYMALLVLTLAAFLGLARANSRPRNIARNHLVALALAYLILPPIFALPLVQRAAGGAAFGAAWFEMISAFTTTGATVFQADLLKPSVHLWRAQVGWMGGFFGLVMAFAVLAPLNLGGIEVVSGRMPGRASAATAQITRVADPVERMRRFASNLLPIYGGLTLLAWLGLMMAGEDSLVALCHAMSTLSTSGITPLVNFADAQAGAAGEMVLALFLTLAISRKLLLRLMGESHDNRLWRDDEVRLAMVLVLGVSAALFLWHLIGAASLGQAADLRAIGAALWGLFFTCFSFLTTTGFVSTHWAPTNLWSGLPATDMVLWSLAIVGGGVATTAGGVKLLRVLALLRYGEQELDRVVHPNSVPRRVDSGGLSRAAALQGTTMAWVFFMTFGLSIAAFAALLTLAGQSFDAALVLTLASLTTTGPLTDQSAGIVLELAAMDGITQSIIGLAMVVGRLETLAILALLVPEHLRG